MRQSLGLLIFPLATAAAAQPTGWAPSNPGKASIAHRGNVWTLKNKAFQVDTDFDRGSMTASSGWSPTPLHFIELFSLEYGDAMEFHTGPNHPSKIESISVKDGVGIAAQFPDPRHGLNIRYELTLLNGKHYARESVTLQAGDHDVSVANLEMGNGHANNAETGAVNGAPVTIGNYFVGLEHPMSKSTIALGRWTLMISRKLPINAGKSITYSTVLGVAPAGQMRRAFLSYVEDQRPRRYDPFLHYNSWYDLGYFNRYTAAQCVERIHRFGDELEKKRGVALKSFLFDDGWDDPKTVWKFHAGFPNQFTPLTEAAKSYKAGPGVWLSPWGGYAGPREERMTAGKAAGMEIDSEGYALSGPKYYDLFHQVCMDFVQKYGINQFKFDGTGSPDKQYPGSQFSSDFEAAIQLIHDLREANPQLFVNLTTGTWPSPFWTRFADSIWRGGSDHSFDGVGPWREKWITYRDGDTFHEIVSAHSMYPLNSLMLHGMIFAKYAQHLGDDPFNDFRNEIRSYFGTGTQLQEMYITPDLLSKQNWDDLADSAKWNRANRDTLVDTHWVGGDPSDLSVYGWASWSPRKAILTLRNPSDKPQAFSVDPDKVFELPAGTRGTWHGKSPYRDSKDELEIAVGASKVVVLKPFQVMTLEGAIR